MLITRCCEFEWQGIESVGGKFALITTCRQMWFGNLRYCDSPQGDTPSSNGQYYFSITAASEFITIDTLDQFGLTNVQPYTGCFNFITGSNNIKVRNIGTAASPLSLGPATYNTGYFLVCANGSALWRITFVRIYVSNTRTGIYQNCDNSVNQLEFRNCWFDAADVLIPIPKNFVIKGCKLTNTTTDQDVIYGTHWFDIFTSDTAGRLGICFNEKSSKEPSISSYEAVTLGETSGFDGTGKLELPSTGDDVIYTTPYWVLGHPYFDPTEATLTGTTPNNIDLFYDIDKGSGFLGSWRNLHYKRTGGATTNTSPTITMTSTTGVSVGDLIYGTGVPSGAFIIAVVNGTTCTMSKNATATGSSLVFRFNALPMKTGVAELTFASSGYTNAVASDIGKAVVYFGGSPTDSGTLLGFDNTNRIWWVRFTDPAVTFSNTSTAIVITSGTGTGTLSAAATVNALIASTGFKLKIRCYVTAGVASSNLQFVTVPTVTTAALQQAGQYDLDSQTYQSQFNMGFN
jgi:hypothetical protein